MTWAKDNWKELQSCIVASVEDFIDRGYQMVWGELFPVTEKKNIAYHKKVQDHVEGQTLQQMVWETVVKEYACGGYGS